MKYNTQRQQLTMPEYGRHIQEMILHLKTINDREKRQKNAELLIEMMGVLNPHLKNVEDFRHKLWDHLFLISDFDLDVKSPYPQPTKEILNKKPEPLPYPDRGESHRHLGTHIMTLIKQAKQEEDEEKRAQYTKLIAYYMKLAYNNWHKETVHDEMIKEEINILSGGILDYTIGDVKLKFTNKQKKSSNTKNNNNSRNNFNRNKNKSNKGRY